jgi:hypothetical protein
MVTGGLALSEADCALEAVEALVPLCCPNDTPATASPKTKTTLLSAIPVAPMIRGLHRLGHTTHHSKS